MKIDEPKTPYVPRYDPSQDEDEDDMEREAQERMLDAQDLVVDELDKVDGARKKKKVVRESDIPSLELGEPEEDFQAADQGEERIFRERSLSGEKHVMVDNESISGGDEGECLMTSEEAKEKHRRFEERRKKHYEMKNIKDLLG